MRSAVKVRYNKLVEPEKTGREDLDMALMQVDFFSNVLGMCVQMDVILPQQTSGQIGMETKAGEKFPTLYLLHGLSDDHTIWLRRTSIERYVSEMNLAVVMPTTHVGWYADMAYGNRYWTYLTQELPQVCRSFFRGMSDKREDTFIAGLSMGGYGAFKAALGAPQTFCAGASLSGALDVAELAHGTSLGDAHYWYTVFGDPDKVKGSQNDVFHLAEQCKSSGQMPRLYQWCGTEDSLYAQNVRMRDHLQRLGYDLTYEESPGDHRWCYWDEKIQSVLNWWEQGRGK